MIKLTKGGIHRGAIVEIRFNKRFEGYAKLIKPDGVIQTFMEIEDGPVFIRQRWLIEWIDSAEFDHIKMKRKHHITQMTLKGKRTHRNIEWYAAPSWENYADQYGPLSERSETYTKPIDDFNGIF